MSTINAQPTLGIVKYPCHLGQEKSGVEKTPDFLPDVLENYLQGKHITLQTYECPEIEQLDLEPSEDENALFQANLILRQRSLQSLKTNRKTLNIGGDHTMGMGTVSAFLECFAEKEKMVLWIDAHADANTREASTSGHYHGMPLAFLLGLDQDARFPVKVQLKPEELLYVGLRDVDPFEKNQVILKHHIRCISTSQLLNEDLNELIRRFVGQGKYVHISWDVDSTDPDTEICSTGTTAKNGLTCERIQALIQTIARENHLVSFDMTELNLALGTLDERKRSLDKTIDVLNSYIDC